MYLELLLHLSVYYPIALQPPDGFVNENFPKLFLSKFSKNSLYYSTSLRQEKGKKMVIHERVSLFILLVLRCAWPLGDITAVESCMRWRLTDNEHLDLTFYFIAQVLGGYPKSWM